MNTQSAPLGGYSRNNGTIYGVDKGTDNRPNSGGIISLIFGLVVAIVAATFIFSAGANF